MESGWNVWVWLVGVVSMRWVWLVGEGGIYGCGCKEVYKFPHTTYPYSSCICSFLYLFFLQQHPFFFVHFFKMFFVLVPVFFVIKFYVLNNFFAQYKNTYGRLWASHGSHMKAAHNFLYTKKHIQMYASYPAIDISCITSRSMV